MKMNGVNQTDQREVRSAPRGLLPMMLTLGPGIVLAGGVIGSGELINTPLQAAEFGFVLLWAVILSCLIKYFLQVEVGRHCLVHGLTVFEALNRQPGPKLWNTSWIVLAFMFSWTLAQIGSAGIIGALAGLMHGVVPLPLEAGRSVQFWAVIVVLAVLLLLWKSLYGQLERLMVVLVVGFSVSVVLGLVMLQGTEYRIGGDEIFAGLTFSLGEKTPRLAAYAVISLMGALGVAGHELFVYPYWVLEKGYARNVGSSERAGWEERARGWVRMMRVDAGLATLLATVVTSAYFLLGAAVLYRQGQSPQGIGLVEQMSGIFTQSYGNWSRGVFLLGAFFTLFSTLLAATAANGRLYTDLLCSLGFVDRSRSLQRSHQVMQGVFLTSVLLLSLWLKDQPEKLVIFSHYVIGLVGTPLAMFGICWIAFRTDRRVRMGWLTAVLLLGSVVVITTCVAFGLAVQRGWV